jgi:hypothetical protein
MSTCITATAVTPSCVTAEEQAASCLASTAVSTTCVAGGSAGVPSPLVSLETTSEEGSGTLVGFSEFNGQASSPPKKYLRLASSGNTTICYRTGASCSSAYFLQDSYSFDVADVVYDPNTGLANTVPLFHWVRSSSTCAFQQSGSALAAGNVTQRSNLTETGNSIVITPTTYTRESLGTCVPSGPNYYTLHGTTQQVLSEEDTEEAAILRASTTPGTSATAARELRGAGVFTFDFILVAYDLICTDLVNGISYQISYDLNTEDYGGGNSVVTSHTINFVASGTSYPYEGLLSPALGKQVTIQNVSIDFL